MVAKRVAHGIYAHASRFRRSYLPRFHFGLMHRALHSPFAKVTAGWRHQRARVGLLVSIVPEIPAERYREAEGKSGEAGYERAGKGRKKKQWNFKGDPIHGSLHRKASSACMGSPLNGEAATPPTHHNSSKDTTSLEIASRHNQGSTLGDETKICSLAIPRWAAQLLFFPDRSQISW